MIKRHDVDAHQTNTMAATTEPTTAQSQLSSPSVLVLSVGLPFAIFGLSTHDAATPCGRLQSEHFFRIGLEQLLLVTLADGHAVSCYDLIGFVLVGIVHGVKHSLHAKYRLKKCDHG